MAFDFMDIALALVAGYALGLALGRYWQDKDEHAGILAMGPSNQDLDKVKWVVSQGNKTADRSLDDGSSVRVWLQ